MSQRHVLARLRQRWAQLKSELGGRGAAGLYLSERLLHRVSGGRCRLVPYLLVAQPLDNPVLRAVRSDAGTEVRRIQPHDTVVPQFPRPPHVNRARFEQGAECHVAWVKGRFAGHIWIARQRYEEDEVRCQFVLDEPGRAVWDFDVFIEPELRLSRTMARLWQAVDRRLHAEGIRWTFSRINRFNIASMQSHARLGATAVGRVTFLCLGPLQLAWSDLAPGLKLSLPGQPGPTLRLRAPVAAS
jgi:hypothetical protein